MFKFDLSIIKHITGTETAKEETTGELWKKCFKRIKKIAKEESVHQLRGG